MVRLTVRGNINWMAAARRWKAICSGMIWKTLAADRRRPPDSASFDNALELW